MGRKILVTGSAGQIGSELVPHLRSKFGDDGVVAGVMAGQAAPGSGPSEEVDVTDPAALAAALKRHRVDTVYHLAAVLSAAGENSPQLAWSVNVNGLKNVLDCARELGVSRVFWPSSIAVFGRDAPKKMVPQGAALNPSTIYGVTKVTGELLCAYYFEKLGLDVRSVRYPGLISGKTRPGGGTTDYAVEMFYDAVEKGNYTCFVGQETTLPMMYMPDALVAATTIMDADRSRLSVRGAYNLSAMSFSAGELAAAIARRVPGFSCRYAPDARQATASSWPESVDDSLARSDWGWNPSFGLDATVEDMLSSLSVRLQRVAKNG